jgi:hypothetical protein
MGIVTLGQVNYQINMKYYMKTGITEFRITGVWNRHAGTSEFSNLKTGTLEFGITGGFPVVIMFWKNEKYSKFLNHFITIANVYCF